MNIQSFACDWPESIPESSRVSEKGCFNVIQAHLFCLADSLANFTRTWKPSGSLIQSFATRLQGSVYRAKDWSQIVVMLLLDACRLDFSPFCRTFDVDNVDSLWCKARLEVMQNFWRFHAVVAEFLLVTSYRSNTSAILRCWLVGLWQMACAISGHPCIREIISWRAASLGRGISPQADVDPMPHSWPKAINKSFQPEPKLAHEITLNMLSSFPIASPLLNWSTGLCITIEGFESLRRRCWACMLGGECQDVQGKSKGNSGPCRIFKKGKLSSDRKNRHIDLVTKRNDLCLSRQMIFFFLILRPTWSGIFGSVSGARETAWDSWDSKLHKPTSSEVASLFVLVKAGVDACLTHNPREAAVLHIPSRWLKALPSWEDVSIVHAVLTH